MEVFPKLAYAVFSLWMRIGRVASVDATRENNSASEEEGEYIPHPVVQKFQIKLSIFSNGETLAFGIGICQLLEEYAKTSLKSQYIVAFPTTVLKSVNLLLDTLDNWKWEEKPLIYANIGSPSALIQNLKGGFYEPYLSEGVKKQFVKKRSLEIRIANELKNDLPHDWDSVMNLVDMADMNLSAIRAMEVIAEKIAVEDFQDIDEDSIKGKLQRLSEKLEKALNDRLKTIPIMGLL